MPEKSIELAVIPSAGYGTRLRPITAAIPKEMLPLGRKPVLEYVVEEVRAAGIRKALFVVSPGKEIIERYFGNGERFGIQCEYVVQPQMLGLGDAILHAEQWTDGQPFVVAFGDCIIESAHVLPLSRLIATHFAEDSSATVMTERIPRERTNRYGILKPKTPTNSEEPFQVAGVIEKPDPDAAPSNFAIAARWALNSDSFNWIRNTPAARNGELNLTDAVALMIEAAEPAWAVPFMPGERRVDIGGWDTYLQAAARYALANWNLEIR